MSMRLMTVETTRQAATPRSPVANSAETIGMSADDSAPAATSWKIRSGIRNAAKNASSSPAQQAGVADDDEPDVAEQARDEERARDDDPGPGEGLAGGHGAGSRRARGWASR